MVTNVKLRRIEWLDHLIRMENNSIPKIVLDAKLDGEWKTERPRLRWLDYVQADLKIMVIKGWRRKVQDRSEGTDIIRVLRSNCEGRNAIE
jgi:hypothetical protein